MTSPELLFKKLNHRRRSTLGEVTGPTQFRRLVAGFSLRRTKFDPTSSHVGFVVNKVALGQVCSNCLGFFCHFSSHLLLHTHLSTRAETIGPIVAGVLSELTRTPPHELKHEVLRNINRLLSFYYILSILCSTDRTENTTYRSSTLACVFVAAGTCLSGGCLETLGGTYDTQTAK
jgi:hypothetical protein